MTDAQSGKQGEELKASTRLHSFLCLLCESAMEVTFCDRVKGGGRGEKGEAAENRGRFRGGKGVGGILGGKEDLS